MQCACADAGFGAKKFETRFRLQISENNRQFLFNDCHLRLKKFVKLLKKGMHLMIWRVFVANAVRACWLLTPVLAPKSSTLFCIDACHWPVFVCFTVKLLKKTCAPYELTSFCRQCSALADVQFWRQKRKGDVSEKIRNLLKEAVGFFSQSHHDPQGSRLKIFPGLAFGGLPTFFARANIQSICTTTRSKPVFSRNIS